jgi:hypothetical protein
MDLNMPRDEWEEWELSTHLPGDPHGYWFEGQYERDSICGRFHIRRILATRRDFVERISEAVSNFRMIVDELYFPQSLLGRILNEYSLTDDCVCYEFVYVADRLSYFLRVESGDVTHMSLLPSPPEVDARRLVETVGTILSWHGGEPSANTHRVLVDGGGSGEAAIALASKLGFSRFNPQPISELLDGSIDQPEHFLLPLGALGVI